MILARASQITPGKKARDVGDQIVDFGGREGDLATSESGSYGGLSLHLRLREGVAGGGFEGVWLSLAGKTRSGCIFWEPIWR